MPFRQMFCAELLVESLRIGVPVQHDPFHAPALLRFSFPFKMFHEERADAMPPELWQYENVFDVKCGAAEK